MDITQLRDFSLGALAILAMAWVLTQVIKWSLDDRKAQADKVEEWYKQRLAESAEHIAVEREDKLAMMGLVKENTAALTDFRGVMAQLKDILASLVGSANKAAISEVEDRASEEAWRKEQRQIRKAKDVKPA